MSELRVDNVSMKGGHGKAVFEFNTLADLKSAPVVEGQLVRTLGYYTVGDGGGNDYTVVATGTGVDDGGCFIDLDNGLQAEGVFYGVAQIEQFGAIGDGVADDTSHVKNALLCKKRLRSLPCKTYRITEILEITEFLSLKTAGSKFLLDYSETSTPAFKLKSGSSIDKLSFLVPSGKVINKVVVFEGEELHEIGHISISSEDQQNNRASNYDAAVGFLSENIVVGSGNVENFDNSYYIKSRKVDIGVLHFSSYVRGLWILESEDFSINKVIGRKRSANAYYSPGHNGVLFSQSKKGNIRIIDVEDAGEHGVRFGGGSIEGNSDIEIGYLRAHNVGGCGLKLRPNTGQRNRRIYFGTVSLSDCGEGLELGPNEEGLLAERFIDIRIGELHVFKVNKPSSCSRGIRISNLDGFYVNSARLDHCQDNPIFLGNTSDNGVSYSDLTNININADITVAGKDGILVLTENIDLRHIYISSNIRGVALKALSITGSGRFITQSHFGIYADDIQESPVIFVSDSIVGIGYLNIDVFDSVRPVSYRPGSSQAGVIREFKSDVGADYTTQCVIYNNGNIENSNNSYGGLSDSRVKDDITAMSDQWEDIKKLKPRRFYNKVSGVYNVGLVSQEVEEVCPGLVNTVDTDKSRDFLRSAYPEESAEFVEELLAEGDVMSVKYSVLNIKLLDVVQSLQKRIEELENTKVN